MKAYEQEAARYVTTGLSMSEDMRCDGYEGNRWTGFYMHNGYAIDAPHYIAAGSTKCFKTEHSEHVMSQVVNRDLMWM
jgi:hypothetical protein